MSVRNVTLTDTNPLPQLEVTLHLLCVFDYSHICSGLSEEAVTKAFSRFDAKHNQKGETRLSGWTEAKSILSSVVLAL